MTKKYINIFILILLSTISINSLEQKTVKHADKIVTLKMAEYIKYIKNNPPLDRMYRQDGNYYFLVDSAKIKELNRLGLNIINVQQIPLFKNQKTMETQGSNGIYHSYSEAETFLRDLEALYPDMADTFSIGKSIEGREINIIKISDNVQANENEPNIYIFGCHHAREWISVEVPLLLARYLLENYHTNSDVEKAVNGSQIFIMPIVNPDGLEFSIKTYRWWRKNRRYNGDLIWGVDLNRNYGYMWGFDDIGSSPSPASEVYRGLSPFSEPETTAIMSFLSNHPPSASISFHNFGNLILYPWGYTAEVTPDDAEMENLAREMSDRIFNVNGNVYQYGPGAVTIYPTNGDTDDWVYGNFGAFAFTIELPPAEIYQGGFFTSQEEITSVFNENLPAMLYFINYFAMPNSKNVSIKIAKTVQAKQIWIEKN